MIAFIRWTAPLTAVLAVTLTSCSQSTAPQVAQLPPPAVTVALPIVREITDSDEFEGRIESIDRIEIRARVRGYITNVAFSNGQRVKKGDLLYEIDPRPYEAILHAAEAKKAAADASVQLATVEYDRTKQLVTNSAASRSELDVWTGKKGVALADLLLAEADIEQAKLDIEFTKITAPIDGKMSRTNVTLGNLVSGTGDAVLATLVSTSPMYVQFDVDERRLLGYRTRAIAKNTAARDTSSLRDAKIPVFVALDGETGFPHKGFLDSADNRIRSSTGTISALAIIDNPTGLLDDGLRARVRLPVGDPYQALLVTDRAIGSEQGIRFLYVVDAANKVARREVALGRVVDGLQVITSNLSETDRVIVNGIQRVREGIEVVPTEVPMPGGGPPPEPAATSTPEPAESKGGETP